ncbi:polysaccharide deacetylase family protein [Paenibacillus sp. LMG 31461]|uniref:Polysaccharide deacetylase family protein n=1 Tax=Paenibacillus plantarum TaxID=2654975 RepID=A0ABX1X2L3_9BACL|nr:polysaccharide deacetylase family protein [Paenibacillus plantarum]NOU62654.1 polysaccharide deacetylase family protein [Paenibacillus plantarum]
MPKIMMAFPQGKHKVVTMSYDDGQTADIKLVEVFNKFGIRGTFHLNSGMLGTDGRISEKEVAELYGGHEVSAHTLTHPTIARCPKEQIIEEIFEYPNGSYSKTIIEMLPYLGVEYARTAQSTGQFAMPDDLLAWRPTCHHNSDLMNVAETFVNLNKTQYLYMLYVWGHSYEFDQDNNWSLIENFCEFIGNRLDIWYATNMEIVDYLKAFQNLKFAASCQFVYNPSALSVWLQVDNQIIEVRGGGQIHLK